jgi:hypothetical protein
VIAGIVGRLFRIAARFRSGPAAADLARVGEELVRLEHRRAQAPTTSR